MGAILVQPVKRILSAAPIMHQDTAGTHTINVLGLDFNVEDRFRARTRDDGGDLREAVERAD